MKKFRLPPGLGDELDEQLSIENKVSFWMIKRLHERGFSQIKTPLLEYFELFEDYRMPNQKMYRLGARDSRELVIRPDMTLPVARFLSTQNVKLPAKFFYIGDLYRKNRDLSGLCDQACQLGVELVGYASKKAELECLELLSELNRTFLDGRLNLELGHAKLADEALKVLSIDEEKTLAIKEALFEKKLPLYFKLIEPFRSNRSYPFFKAWPRLFGSVEEVETSLKKLEIPETIEHSLNEVFEIAKACEVLGGHKASLDLSAPGPQPYYTGIVFKGYLPNASRNVISGGRYDRMLESFQEEPEPAVGMGIELSFLSELLKDRMPRTKTLPTLVYFEKEQLKQAMDLVKNSDSLQLSLSDTLEEAVAEAKRLGSGLIDLTKEG